MTGDIALNGEGHLFIVGDDGLVLVPRSQQLFALNTTATLVWCCLEEGQGRREIVDTLVETFRIDPDTAARYVEDALGLWRGWGVLQGTEIAAEPKQAEEPDLPLGEAMPAEAEAAIRHRRRYRLLDGTAAIAYGDDDSLDWVHPILAHLAIGDADGDLEALSLHVVREDDGYALYRDRRRWPGRLPLSHLGPLVKGHVWQGALGATPHAFNIHAGVVADDAGCILLPGRPGSGKSTLTAALARSGYAYLSDEVALLESPRLRARPVPLAICVKSTGWDALERFYPELVGLRSHGRGDGKIVRYVPPPIDAAAAEIRHDVTRIVFPRYVPGCRTSLKPMPAVEGLQRLLHECVAAPEGLSVAAVETIVEWLGRLSFWELEQSTLDDAIAAIATTRSGVHATTLTVGNPDNFMVNAATGSHSPSLRP